MRRLGSVLTWAGIASAGLAIAPGLFAGEPSPDSAAAKGYVPTTTYEYNHVGVPTTVVHPGENYSSTFKMYVSGGEDSPYRVQWLRFEKGTPLNPLLTTLPHVAFKVPSIDEAIKGHHVILEPYFPFPGFRVAAIEDHGAPIEFTETALSDREIWSGSKEDTYIFPKSGPAPTAENAVTFVATTRYRYHHLGVPTTVPHPGERYSSTFKMYASGGGNSAFRVEWLRFEKDSPLDPLLTTLPHVAFLVPSLDEAIKGAHVILKPYSPFPGYRVAAIEDHGAPIEFIETNLSEEEIWYGAKENTYLFPK